GLGGNHDMADFGNLAHHDISSSGIVRFVEIRGYALLDILCLPHVQYFTFFVKILIDSRIVGKRLYLKRKRRLIHNANVTLLQSSPAKPMGILTTFGQNASMEKKLLRAKYR